MESIVGEVLLGVVVLGGAHYAIYGQILDHAANQSARDSSLAGGKWLDVLAVLAVIQLGGAFDTRMFWCLLVLPAWGAWSLYHTVMGKQGLVGSMTSGNGGGSNSSAATGEPMAAPVNRKQRRAEQRNQRR